MVGRPFVQLAVAAEFSLPPAVGRRALRQAPRWIGEEKAKALSLYRHHNRVVRERGLVPEVGDPAPFDRVPPLPMLDGGLLDLSTLGSGRPLVLVAASGS